MKRRRSERLQLIRSWHVYYHMQHRHQSLIMQRQRRRFVQQHCISGPMPSTQHTHSSRQLSCAVSLHHGEMISLQVVTTKERWCATTGCTTTRRPPTRQGTCGPGRTSSSSSKRASAASALPPSSSASLNANHRDHRHIKHTTSSPSRAHRLVWATETPPTP